MLPVASGGYEAYSLRSMLRFSYASRKRTIALTTTAAMTRMTITMTFLRFA